MRTHGWDFLRPGPAAEFRAGRSIRQFLQAPLQGLAVLLQQEAPEDPRFRERFHPGPRTPTPPPHRPHRMNQSVSPGLDAERWPLAPRQRVCVTLAGPPGAPRARFPAQSLTGGRVRSARFSGGLARVSRGWALPHRTRLPAWQVSRLRGTQMGREGAPPPGQRGQPLRGASCGQDVEDGAGAQGRQSPAPPLLTHSKYSGSRLV